MTNERRRNLLNRDDARLRLALRCIREMPCEPGQPILPAGPLPAGSRLPVGPNQLFTGREDELRRLARILQSQAGVIIHPAGTAGAAGGLGGQGKSALARAFAHRYGRYFQGGVFWISLADPAGVAAEVAGCGRAMGLPGFDGLTLNEQIDLVRRVWQEPMPRLLIFDGCDGDEAAGITAEALLQRWRPAGGGARLLVTSRKGGWEPEPGLAYFPLAGLRREDSVQFLAKHWPDGLPMQEWRTAGLIANEAGDLPLALHLAGHYLFERGQAEPLEWYLAHLKELRLGGHGPAGARWAGPGMAGPGMAGPKPAAHDEQAGRVLELSWRQLDPARETDAAALALLARLACLPPEAAVPWPVAGGAVEDGPGRGVSLRGLVGQKDAWWAGPPPDAGALVDGRWRLLSLGLVTAIDPCLVEAAVGGDGLNGQATGGRKPSLLMLHRLVRQYARAVLPAEALAAAGRDLARMMAAEAQRLNAAGERWALLAWQGLLRLVTDQALAHPDAEAGNLAHEFGSHLYLTGDAAGARPYLERAVAIRRARPAAKRLDLAASLERLGQVLLAMAAYDEARACLEKALAIYEKALGPEWPETAAGLDDLGDLYFAQGVYGRARRYYERALAIREKTLGAEHLATVDSVYKLGAALQAQGDPAGARSCYDWALLVSRGLLGKAHPDTAAGLIRLGRLQQIQGEYEAARPYLEEALAIREAALGPDHPDTADGLINLAYLLQDVGELAEARACLERALAILGATLGPDHGRAAAVRADLVLLNAAAEGFKL